jgi:hypothetical protein
MCQAGNRVVFEDLEGDVGGYVENIASKARIPIKREGGTYKVTMWRPRAHGNPQSPKEGASYFQCLAPVEEEFEIEEGKDVCETEEVNQGVSRPVQVGGASSSTFQRPA